MSQILAGTTDSLVQFARVERENERQLRAALLRLGGYLGWDERAVIRFCEAITGRSWSRCGAAEVLQVGRALLDVAVAIRAGNGTDVAATPGRTTDDHSTVRDAQRLYVSRAAVDICADDGCQQPPRLFDTAAQRGD